MKRIIFILCLFIKGYLMAQITISGVITDEKGIPIEEANVN